MLVQWSITRLVCIYIKVRIISVCLTLPAQSSIIKKLEQNLLMKTLKQNKNLNPQQPVLSKMAHQVESKKLKF